MLTTMNRLISLTVKIFVFLFPIFFLYITSESYEYNKMALLVITVVILLTLYTLKIVHERRFTVLTGTFGLPLFFLSGIAVISTLFQSPNLSVSLTTPLSTTTIVSGFVLYLLLINILTEEEGKRNLSSMTIFVFDTVLLCLYVICMYAGILPKNSFTPAGNLLATTIFISIVAVYLLSKLIVYLLSENPEEEYLPEITDSMRKLKSGFFLLHFLSLLVIGGTTIFLTIQLATDQKLLILPFSFGWHIFAEVLKDPRSFFLGIGPANFLTAFTFAKPPAINNTPFFNIIFTSSSSFLLNLATEAGIIAAIIFFIIILKVIKIIKNGYLPFTLPLLFSLILQIFLPSNMSVFILTIILLAFASEKKHLLSIDLAFLGKSVYFILLPVIIITILVIYFGGRVYLAEVIYKQSLDALVNSRGTDAYNLQTQALILNPYLDHYHVVFSQTNLALANTLASRKDISGEDKQRIPRFVQQSIDHARTAVTLYRTNAVNWDNLARIYASLTTYAKDADAWAETSYQQKIQLDPLNPNSKLSLGGFYLQMQKWDMAENLFRQAVSLKPDFANAHFNLAVSYRHQKKYTESYKELQISMALVSPNSTDSAKIKEELDLLPPEAVTESTVPGSSNLPPQKLEGLTAPEILKNPSGLKPPIPLPQPP